MKIENKDPELWKVAQKRARFKYHALIYFIMNIFFWTIWYISLRNNSTPYFERNTIPWPVWPMLIWGIGLLVHYLAVRKAADKLVQREYDKLKRIKDQ